MSYLRIKKKKDFSKILQAGKRGHSASLTVVYFPSKEVRYAVCVGKKFGKSVKRNAIKRLLREALRAYIPFLVSPYSLLLMPKVEEEYSYARFLRDIGRILVKEKLIEAETYKHIAC